MSLEGYKLLLYFIAEFNNIINNSLFSLSPNYFSNFKQTYQNSKENIFVIPYDQNTTEQYECFYFLSLYYNSYLKYITVDAPWNDICAFPDHYHSFDSTDNRRKGWSTGSQFEADEVTPLWVKNNPYKDSALNFTPDFIDIYSTSGHKYDTLNYYQYQITMRLVLQSMRCSRITK